MFFMGAVNAIFVALSVPDLHVHRIPADAGMSEVYVEHDGVVLLPAGIGYCGG